MGSTHHVSYIRNYLIEYFFCFINRGPSGTPFEFGVFVTRLHFPSDYPLSPPKMKFISDIFHPNGKKNILIHKNNSLLYY